MKDSRSWKGVRNTDIKILYLGNLVKGFLCTCTIVDYLNNF